MKLKNELEIIDDESGFCTGLYTYFFASITQNYIRNLTLCAECLFDSLAFRN